MKKLLVIIPAVVLGIGAATAGVLASAATEDKTSISVDYTSAFSKASDRNDEKQDSIAVSLKAAAQNNFIDENNDGICDNYADGACPQNGTGNGYGRGNSNFVDENNDGICDNRADGTCPRNGTGNGYGRGNGNFVDENNDGICDNYANGACPRNGTGNGYGRGKGCGRNG